MKKKVSLLFLMLLLLTTGATRVWAEEELPPRLQKLADEAYHYYSSRGTENFFESLRNAVGAASEESGARIFNIGHF